MGFGSFVGGLVGKVLGGGGSSSSQTSNQKVTVENDVTVNIPIDELATEVKNASFRDIFFRAQELKTTMTAKEIEAKQKQDALKLNAVALQEQREQNRTMTALTVIGLIVAAIGLFWNKRKGKK